MFLFQPSTAHGFDSFYIDLTLSPPGGVDMAMDIYHAQEGTTTFDFWETVDDRGSGGTETYNYGGWAGFSDEGYYMIRVYANSGADCNESYLFKVEGEG